MIITLCAGKGSPGVTTIATALAYSWPTTPVLAEVDPSGCDLPYRVKSDSGQALSATHGIMSLAGACRQKATTPQLLAHAQSGAGEQPIVVGPENAEQSAAIGRYWNAIADQLWTHTNQDIVVDAGRLLSEKSLVSPVLQRSHLVVVVSRATPSGMAHLQNALVTVSKILNTPSAVRFPGSALDRIAVLSVCDPGGRKETAAALAETRQVVSATTGLSTVPVLAAIPFDSAGAATFAGFGRKRLDRTKISRSLVKVIPQLQATYDNNEQPVDDYAMTAGA